MLTARNASFGMRGTRSEEVSDGQNTVGMRCCRGAGWPGRLARRTVVPVPVSCREGADLDKRVGEDPFPASDSGAIGGRAGRQPARPTSPPDVNAASGGRAPGRRIAGVDRGGSVASPTGGTVREADWWMRSLHRHRGGVTKRLQVIAEHRASPPRISQGAPQQPRKRCGISDHHKPASESRAQ
jgi:hypothetical protein